ncbi:hypothetical protein [Aeromicrobium sp.]|uniref:hypothetical protein n=1 Tax=Aeromicrobium sp. TaxID=1871063 RepID=UPI0028B1BFFD|nr:hypothetical protein [Aeromicrobium sp.]
MRRIIGLLALVLMMSGCVGDTDDPPEPAATSDAVEEGSLVGLDMPDEMLLKSGMTPVRTMPEACALLFDRYDFPALAVEWPTSELGDEVLFELQNVLMTVAYSGPDVLRDHVGALIDHTDLPASYVDSETRAEAQWHAGFLAAACAVSTG